MDAYQDIIDAILKHDRFLISTHIRSDGDAIGSEMAAWRVLTGLGKRARIVNDGPVPRVFQFLDPDQVIEIDPERAQPDAEAAALVLDATSLDRIGKAADLVRQTRLIINIDHHVSNERFGALNLVDPDASSTGEIVYRLLRRAGAAISAATAAALYAAILTDTGRFTHANTSPAALEAAAEVVRLGARPAEIAEQVYYNEPVGLSLLRAQTGATLELFHGGEVAVMHMTREMLQQTGVDPIDTQDFADLPRALEGVEVGVLLRELPEPNKVKVSLRSKRRADVNAVAQTFGGGGHVRAAGCTVEGELHEVKRRVVEAVVAALEAS